MVGSSSEYILRHAKVDLLVVRDKDKTIKQKKVWNKGSKLLNVDKLLFYIKQLDDFQKWLFFFEDKNFPPEKSARNAIVSSTRSFESKTVRGTVLAWA